MADWPPHPLPPKVPRLQTLPAEQQEYGRLSHPGGIPQILPRTLQGVPRREKRQVRRVLQRPTRLRQGLRWEDEYSRNDGPAIILLRLKQPAGTVRHQLRACRCRYALGGGERGTSNCRTIRNTILKDTSKQVDKIQVDSIIPSNILFTRQLVNLSTTKTLPHLLFDCCQDAGRHSGSFRL